MPSEGLVQGDGRGGRGREGQYSALKGFIGLCKDRPRFTAWGFSLPNEVKLERAWDRTWKLGSLRGFVIGGLPMLWWCIPYTILVEGSSTKQQMPVGNCSGFTLVFKVGVWGASGC